MTERKEITIGTVLYVFDENYRRYKLDENGRSIGGPIYREHFRPVTVTGETRLSWITNDREVKIKKATMLSRTWNGFMRAFDREEMENDIWAHETRPKIIKTVTRCDAILLRKISNFIDLC